MSSRCDAHLLELFGADAWRLAIVGEQAERSRPGRARARAAAKCRTFAAGPSARPFARGIAADQGIVVEEIGVGHVVCGMRQFQKPFLNFQCTFPPAKSTVTDLPGSLGSTHRTHSRLLGKPGSRLIHSASYVNFRNSGSLRNRSVGGPISCSTVARLWRKASIPLSYQASTTSKFKGVCNRLARQIGFARFHEW